MKAMILAAGLGTRLKPITDRLPKALLPIGGKTLLEWQLDKLRAAGIREVVINVHHLAEQVTAFVAEHDAFGMDIRFSDERDMLLETGGGLRKAAPLFGDNEPVLVCNVDVLNTIDLHALMAAHDPDALATIVVSRRDTQRYFLFDKAMRLAGWTNIQTGAVRPEGLNPDGLERLAFSGMHIVSPEIFPLLNTYPDKFSITDFYINECSTHRIDGYVPSHYSMMDIGKIDHLREAEAFAKGL